MLIYSVTVKIDNSVQSDWKKWMKEVHLPDVMKTGLFQECKMCKVLNDNDPDATTYNMQYLCHAADFQKYQENYAVALQKDHTERYKDKYVAFRTMLKVEEVL